MPRQLSLVEIDEYKTERLKVISSALLNTKMSVHRSIAGCSSEIFTIPVGYVFSSFGVTEPFGKPEINNIDKMLLLSDANQEVVWLNVTMQKMSRVNKLQSLKHLIRQHENCLELKLPLAVVEQILKRGSQKINNHHIIVTLDSEPVHIWDTNYN